MNRKRAPEQDRPTAVRVGVAAAAGVAAGVAVGVTGGWSYAAAAGWTVAAAVLVAWTWLVIARMSPQQTAKHATRENPARALTDLLVLSASVASLVGVGYLLAAGSSGHGAGAGIAAGLGIADVVGAWAVVHTVFTLRYALLYYTDGHGGIDFNQSEEPAYVDFAYLAFTLGMTYQVSDTDLKTRTIRATALRHALLSYLLGAVVLATVINLVAGLGSNSGG
ncbi:MAG: DUF1345 domain-containing protein [Pseudonocardia sp.]|nr:DUF1345 domain-containing protein [Pseudonocardia sp.]